MGFNTASGMRSHVTSVEFIWQRSQASFNTASGMRSHVTAIGIVVGVAIGAGFNTASGMRSHVTSTFYLIQLEW